MILRSDEIPRGGRRLSGRLPAEVGGADLPDGALLTAEAEYDVHVRGVGADLQVRGEVRAGVDVRCDRCLGRVAVKVDREFNVTYHAAEGVPDEGERELDAVDLDVDYYDGSELDLGAVIAEQVALALPMKVLCREECSGICPVCGADRNHDPCDCEPPPDPRLEALRGLRD